MYLSGKIKAICSAIEKSSSALRPLSSHADYLACYYSYQTRFDYWFATNSVAFTGPLAVEIDANLCVSFVTRLVSTVLKPLLWALHVLITSERIVLKFRNGGLGIKTYAQR